MLFSDPELAKFIETQFAATWQSVREAPQVTIDFGKGHVVQRTLHGNIATWILDTEGRVLDVLGGIYTPRTYRDRLQEVLHFAASLATQPLQGPATPGSLLVDYHTRQRDRFAIRVPKLARTANPRPDSHSLSHSVAKADISKSVVELAPRTAAGIDSLPMATDVAHNETTRRAAIHGILAETGLVALDEALTARVYREALHCDLEDPYLGLGEMLFGSYPFAR